MSTSKFERAGSELVKKLPAGTTVELCLFEADGACNTLWQSATPDVGRQALEALCKACRERQRTVLVQQGHTSSLFRGVDHHGIESAVCAPVFDRFQCLIGLVLAHSNKVGQLSTSHRYVLERGARDLAGLMATLNNQAPEGDGKSEPSPYQFLYSPTTLIASACLLGFLVLWGFRPAPASSPRASASPITSRTSARAAAEDFLALLQEKKFEEAWASLAPELRAQWVSDDFIRQHQRWLSQNEKNPEILAGRGVSRMTSRGDMTEVLLFESAVPGDSGRWSWSLRKMSDGRWRIVSISGPLSPEGGGQKT